MRRRPEPLPERDPREDAVWFHRLPVGHQAMFRADWARDRARWGELERHERRAFRRCLLEGALLFGGGHLLSGGGGLGLLLLAIVAGALIGLAWWSLDAEALLAPILAMPLFFGLHLMAAPGRMGPSLATGFNFVRFAGATLLVGTVASWMARERHLRVVE